MPPAQVDAAAPNGLDSRTIRVAVVAGALVVLYAVVLRAYAIDQRFYLYPDQIRDWEVALRDARDLPLHGPFKNGGGYSIGPTFWWLLWGLRRVLEPFFGALPHVGGLGTSLLRAPADALLFWGLVRRGLPWTSAAGAVLLLASAPFDAAQCAASWNPASAVMFVELALGGYLATPQRTMGQALAIGAAAWLAVHCHSPAVFVAAPLFLVLVIEQLRREGRARAGKLVAALVGIVALLQVPYTVFLARNWKFLGYEQTEVDGLLPALVHPARWRGREALAFVLDGSAALLDLPSFVGVLLLAAALLSLALRRHVALALPALATIAGLALLTVPLQQGFHYLLLSAMPPLVLCAVLGVDALARARRAQAAVGALLLAAVLALQPARWHARQALIVSDEYAAIVRGARQIAASGRPLAEVEAPFVALPPSTSADTERLLRHAGPQIVLQSLGVRLDPQAKERAVIAADGSVSYELPR